MMGMGFHMNANWIARVEKKVKRLEIALIIFLLVEIALFIRRRKSE